MAKKILKAVFKKFFAFIVVYSLISSTAGNLLASQRLLVKALQATTPITAGFGIFLRVVYLHFLFWLTLFFLYKLIKGFFRGVSVCKQVRDFATEWGFLFVLVAIYCFAGAVIMTCLILEKIM